MEIIKSRFLNINNIHEYREESLFKRSLKILFFNTILEETV